QNPSLLEGYENEVHQALKMAGGAPTVILRTAEGKIIGQASVSDLNAWGFGSSEKPTMEQWGELPPPGLEPSPEPKDTFSTKIQSLRQSLPSFPSSASKSPPPRGAYKFDKAFLGGWKTDGWSRFSASSALYGGLFGAQTTDDLYASRREIRKTEHELR